MHILSIIDHRYHMFKNQGITYTHDLMILGPKSIIGEDFYCYKRANTYSVISLSPKSVVYTISVK